MGCSLRLLSDCCCGPRARFLHRSSLRPRRRAFGELALCRTDAASLRVSARVVHALRAGRTSGRGLGASGRRFTPRRGRQVFSSPTIVEGTTAWNRRSAAFAVSGGRGRRPALGAVSAGGQPWLVSLPAEGRAFIVIARDSRKLDSQRPRPAGWMGGRLQGSYHYSVTRYSTTCAAFCLSTPARFSAPVCTPRTCAASRTCR